MSCNRPLWFIGLHEHHISTVAGIATGLYTRQNRVNAEGEYLCGYPPVTRYVGLYRRLYNRLWFYPLEQIVLTKIQETVALAIGNEKAFAARVHKSANANTEKLIKSKTAELGKTERRITELDKIIKRIYEDHISGKFDDVRFAKLLVDYEDEQKTLTAATETLQMEINELKRQTANVQSFMKVVQRYGQIEELTEETARAFVEKVVVHEAVFATGTKRKKLHQQIDIILTYIGQFNND